MDLHDPESTAKEKAIALKAGRQKKIQIIDGQQVEVLGEEEDEMEEYEDEDILLDESALEGEQGTPGNVMAVQTSDGQQQYIVLEITQLNEGEEAVQQESKVQSQRPERGRGNKAFQTHLIDLFLFAVFLQQQQKTKKVTRESAQIS